MPKGKANPEQIANWKSKHKNIFEIEVEGCFGYVKKPGREVLAHASAVAGNNPVKFNETILDDCWIGGDDSLKNDDEKFLGVSSVLDEIVKVAQASIKKL